MTQFPLRCFLSSVALAAVCAVSGNAWAQAPVVSQVASQPIPGQYLIVFKKTVGHAGELGRSIAQNVGGQVLHSYENAIKGVALRVPLSAVDRLKAALENNPHVESFEPDATVSVNEALLNPVVTQNQATWGLDRIDQQDRPLSGTYQYQYRGNGVFAFIVDTGIRASHAEFASATGGAGRVLAGADYVLDGKGTDDCNGHGTHVAATVGGLTYGVAKDVSLVPVRVLGCTGSGSLSGVVAGVDWLAGQKDLRPAVANMSLGSSKSTTVNAAVAGAGTAGVTMVVAAGNDNANACNYSPASEPSAITVGAVTSGDARSSFSNYGSCVDVFAPGSSITSAWYTSDIATNTISGTSMASPHVAGVAALALATGGSAVPYAVTKFLVDNASVNKLGSLGTGSPNRLVYSLAAGAPVEPVALYVSVESITTGATKGKANWTAYATVKVRDSNQNPVPNATVSGSFVPGGDKTCLTASSGECKLTSSGLSNTKVASTTFTVKNITGSYLTYAANQNAATSAIITRP